MERNEVVIHSRANGNTGQRERGMAWEEGGVPGYDVSWEENEDGHVAESRRRGEERGVTGSRPHNASSSALL